MFKCLENAIPLRLRWIHYAFTACKVVSFNKCQINVENYIFKPNNLQLLLYAWSFPSSQR